MVSPQLVQLAAQLATPERGIPDSGAPRHDRSTFGPEETGQRAVVLVVLSGDPDPVVVLTERSAGLAHHAGQISFPGGGIEPGESAVAAAWREAEEEVALDRARATLLGELPLARLAVRQFAVRVFVAEWPGGGLRAHPAEVAAIAEVPVSTLADPCHRVTWVHPSGRTGPAFLAGDWFIWGFTGFVLDAILRAGSWYRPWDETNQSPVPSRFLGQPPSHLLYRKDRE